MKSSHNGSPNGRSKPGPKLKIDDKAKAEVFACLTVGASLRDAAGYLGVDYKTLWRARQNDPEFAKGVMRAVKKGKLHHLNKIGKASQWQASAWMLERRWGRQFGKREALTLHGSLQHTHEHEIVQNAITDPDSVRLAEALNARMAHDACGHGEPPSPN